MPPTQVDLGLPDIFRSTYLTHVFVGMDEEWFNTISVAETS